MTRRQTLVEKHHPYKIWQDEKGYYNTWLPDTKKGRKRIKRKSRRELESIIEEYVGTEVTIEDVFEEWLDRKFDLKQISRSTYDRYERVFTRHYDIFGKTKIKYVKENDITDFLEEQIAYHELTAKGYANLLTVTKGCFKRAKKLGIVNVNITELIENMELSKNCFRKVIREDYEEVYNPEEMRVIIEYLIHHLDTHNIGILLIFLTGIRVGELVALKHEDFEDFTFKVRRTETRFKDEHGKDVYRVKDYPKTKAGVRTCFIPEDYVWLVERIQNLNPNCEYIFSKNGKQMTTNAIRDRLWRICNKLEIYQKSPHKARKTYISILLDNKVDNNLIISVVGHTNINCSEIHYHRNRKKITQKAKIISNIDEFKMSADVSLISEL